MGEGELPKSRRMIVASAGIVAMEEEKKEEVLSISRCSFSFPRIVPELLWGGMPVSAALTLMSFAEAFLDLRRFVPRPPGMDSTGRIMPI